ncbi:hypothetical protein GEMRC1_006362 [Eukaryota sp. GEM-RC1]
MFKALVVALLFAAVFAEWQTPAYPPKNINASYECNTCVLVLRVIYNVAEASGCANACAPVGPFKTACNAGCKAFIEGTCPSDCTKAACKWYYFCEIWE